MSQYGEPWEGWKPGMLQVIDSRGNIVFQFDDRIGVTDFTVHRVISCVNFLAGVPVGSFDKWPPVRVQASMSLAILKGQFPNGFPDAMAPVIVTLKMLAGDPP